MRKKTITVITGERGQGMTYSTQDIIDYGSRDWYKSITEKLLKDIEDARSKTS